MSSSSMPTTTMLCASCATVDASAPRLRPKPRTKPRPMRPVPWCRSITATLARSRAGSATDSAVLDGRVDRSARRSRPGRGSARSPAPCRRVHGMREVAGSDRLRFAPCAAPSRAPRPRGISPTGAPRLEHELRDRSDSRSRQRRGGRPGSRARSRRGGRGRVPGRGVQRGHDERVLGRRCRRRRRCAPSR